MEGTEVTQEVQTSSEESLHELYNDATQTEEEQATDPAQHKEASDDATNSGDIEADTEHDGGDGDVAGGSTEGDKEPVPLKLETDEDWNAFVELASASESRVAAVLNSDDEEVSVLRKALAESNLPTAEAADFVGKLVEHIAAQHEAKEKAEAEATQAILSKPRYRTISSKLTKMSETVEKASPERAEVLRIIAGTSSPHLLELMDDLLSPQQLGKVGQVTAQAQTIDAASYKAMEDEMRTKARKLMSMGRADLSTQIIKDFYEVNGKRR